MYLFELGRERYWLAPNRASARTPFVQNEFMVRQFCYRIIDTRVPQEPSPGMVNQIAVAGEADRSSDVGSRRPTRFVWSAASPQSMT
jgi:hypothetical protein